MEYSPSVRRYRNWYAKLLRLYPKPYRARFAEGMEQTFSDLLRERAEEKGGLLGTALWVYIDTFGGIIKENVTRNTMHNKNIIRIAIVTAAILAIPLVAMQFTEEVQWTFFDFVFMGILLFGTGLGYELISRRVKGLSYKMAVGVSALTVLFLVWVNGAVGIIGDGDNPSTLMYFGVLFIGLLGMIISRLKPRGMSYTLFAAAGAQALVPAIALAVVPTASWGAPGIFGTFALNSFFAASFAAAGLLFRQAVFDKAQ